MCHAHKSPGVGTRLWANNGQSTQGTRVKSESMVETIGRYEHRTQNKNNFEKESFEQMNNSVIGKTMENVRSHRYIKFVSDVRAI